MPMGMSLHNKGNVDIKSNVARKIYNWKLNDATNTYGLLFLDIRRYNYVYLRPLSIIS